MLSFHSGCLFDADGITRQRNQLKMGSIRAIVLKCLLFLLCNKMICCGDLFKNGHNLGILIEPYNELLNYYNIPAKQNFTESVLEELIHEFAQRIHCSRETSSAQKTGTCTDSFCVSVPSLRGSLGQDNDTFITEENFKEITPILIGIAIAFNESCHTELVITSETVDAYQHEFVRMLKGTAQTDSLQLEDMQDTLEQIIIGNTEESIDDTGDDAHDHALLVKDKCLGADILFDQLGLDVEESYSVDDIGQFTALIVLHILNGAEISRDCRILPRAQFFTTELYNVYGTGNGAINKTGFTNLVDALHTGGDAHEHSVEHADEVHDHEHLTNQGEHHGDMLHKEHWESTCYTDEELLAIFHIYDNTIPSEKFNVICPALVQQTLNDVCPDDGEAMPLTVTLISTADKYGYGTIATFITCLCSVVGAFVVKCTSDKAYNVIMALFMGLAVGTLFTDALLHLLPQAFGIHGHSETEDLDHDHESDGIVVEPFIWIALVACAGLYTFYLFEKILIMFRGQHVHSHGPIDQHNKFSENELNTIQVVAAGKKYNVNMPENKTEKLTQNEQSNGLPSIAIMILMGDAIHNFADGLAIGAGFSSSITVGLSTSIAVFCHELPHELGDFAILLASGVSFGRALALNVLVSATAMAGLYVGLVISDDESVRQWIVAITAGIFLYISLVDMMPQLLQQTDRVMRDFILNNIGLLLGALAMFTIAVFEDKIRV